MAAPPKKPSNRPSKTPVKARATAPSKPATKVLPFLRVYHSEALRSKTMTVLTDLEHAADPTQHRESLAQLIVELNDAGMDYCFLRPLKLAKPGFIVEQSASLGMAGALKVIASVVRNIIGRMDKPQLLSVAASIRKLTL